MTCPYCANGTVYDLRFTGGHWQQQRIGKCKHCAGGDCEPGRMIRAIAEHTGSSCIRVIFQALLGCLEYKMKHHEHAKEAELKEVLKGLYPGLSLEVRPAKAYDFGDGFVEEQPGIPF